jgi:L,D-peptidoglycan transpeptidase YkuD (ErfK/YbiS/YcfS/YnhG family)
MKRPTPAFSPRVRGLMIATIVIASVAAIATLLAPRSAVATTQTPTRTIAAVTATGTPPAEESSATTPVPLPLQMADIGDARQLLIATASKLGDTTGTLRVFDLVDGTWVETLTVSARFGKRGLMDGKKRVAGNKTTPTGMWAMPNYVFGTHVHAPNGSKMKFRRLNSRSWWSSKRGSTYNRWVQARRWTGEHIGGSPKAYEFAVSMGYNARPNPSVYGRGTGIFLHVRGSGLTAGCIAISRSNMIKVCRILDRSKKPHFAVGTLKRGSSTSIWAY